MINQDLEKKIFVVDNFYNNPYFVRGTALQKEFIADNNYYRGKRTAEQVVFPGTKEAFEKIMGQPIVNWTDVYGMCGRFQSCQAGDQIVYHTDLQKWAGMIYLTPNAPVSGGTSMYMKKDTKCRHQTDKTIDSAFEGGYYDRTKFELVDTIGNVFNRLVIFDAQLIHAANGYFGNCLDNSRLFHMFFFD